MMNQNGLHSFAWSFNFYLISRCLVVFVPCRFVQYLTMYFSLFFTQITRRIDEKLSEFSPLTSLRYKFHPVMDPFWTMLGD